MPWPFDTTRVVETAPALEFASFAGEGHGMGGWTPATQADALQRMRDFLRIHLKPWDFTDNPHGDAALLGPPLLLVGSAVPVAWNVVFAAVGTFLYSFCPLFIAVEVGASGRAASSNRVRSARSRASA